MRSALICLVSATLVSCSSAEPESEWTSLLDGNDLAGWTIKFANQPLGENYRNTFRVKDGVLRADFSEWDDFNGEFGHIFTNATYSAYDLRFQYRHTGEQVEGAPSWALRNNGVMIHAQAPEDMGFAQNFPRCLEVQLLTAKRSEGDTRSNGNICTPGTHVVLNGEVTSDHCIPSGTAITVGPGWVDVRVEVDKDGTIRHFINGEKTIEHSGLQVQTDDAQVPANGLAAGTPITSGRIAFQAESHPTEFRNIEIRER